jgi:hypothetical protein
MLVDYFNGCIECLALALWLKSKIMGRTLDCIFRSIFSTYVIYLPLPLDKYKIVSWNETKEIQDLVDFLLSFRYYFVIVEDNLCISRNSLPEIFPVLIVKRKTPHSTQRKVA